MITSRTDMRVKATEQFGHKQILMKASVWLYFCLADTKTVVDNTTQYTPSTFYVHFSKDTKNNLQ